MTTAKNDRQKLYEGFGETFSRAVEFVVTPFLFAWFGHVLDGRLGIRPVLTIALATLAVVGMFLRFWYGYVEAMKVEERQAPWARSRS